jgi:hypothetical protein
VRRGIPVRAGRAVGADVAQKAGIEAGKGGALAVPGVGDNEPVQEAKDGAHDGLR